MARCALFSALLCICAWLAVPVGDGFVTLQTFGIFLCLGILGGRRGTAAIFLYLLLGAVGLPVFSGFRGGAGVLLDATGGYLLGFLTMGLVYWLVTALWSDREPIRGIALVLGLLVCYCFGTLWYWRLYLTGGSIWVVVLKCVVPYLVPDGVKLAGALFLVRRLKQFV